MRNADVEICGRTKNATRSSQLTDKYTIFRMRLICAVDGFVMNVVYDGSFIVLIVLLKTQCVK